MYIPMKRQYIVPNIEQAACATADPELFFVEGDYDNNSPLPGVTRANYKQYKEAVSYCHQCPITLECLLTSLKDKADYGIWGGSTPAMRKRMKSKQHAINFVDQLKAEGNNK